MKSIHKKAIDKNMIKPPYFINSLKAFFIGGLICVIGQSILEMYKNFGLPESESVSLMAVTLILIGSLLTAIGIYDKIGQFAGCGSIIPITGFANSMTSAALEAKSEGLVLGIGTNTFKLAGSVITFGVVSAYVFGIIRFGIEALL